MSCSSSHYLKINASCLDPDHLVRVYFEIMNIWLYIFPYLDTSSCWSAVFLRNTHPRGRTAVRKGVLMETSEVWDAFTVCLHAFIEGSSLNCLFNQCTFNTVDKLADHHTRSQQGISHHNALWLFQTSAGRHGYAAQQSIAQCALSSLRVTCCQSGPVERDNEPLLT